jgi:glyoxylase-like metal-dependent hydrolase (beta-lactamase superfamily II)/rhodanese-related sulfurtransferase
MSQASRGLGDATEAPTDGVAVHAFVDQGLGNTSWVLEVDGLGVVVDPTRNPAPYVSLAERGGFHLVLAAETHLHADFVSGGAELLARGAAALVPARAEAEYAHRGLSAGDEVEVGGLTLRALATPGHSPEHLAYLLLDGRRPLGLFSGGSLLAGAVARTDLIAPERTEELARELWRSLRTTILPLPDDVAVYPTHGSGSFCSTAAGSPGPTTIGAERATNPLLAAPDEDAFVAQLLAGLGTYPPYFARLREVNRRGPTVYGERWPRLASLDVEEAKRLVEAGAELIDVRPVKEFAAGHVPGSLSVPLRPQFATWLGWLVPPDRRVVFVVGADQDRGELVDQCSKIGYDEQLAGELEGGFAAWQAGGRHVAGVRLVEPGQLDRAHVLDVRQKAEFAQRHIPGSQHIELGSLPGRLAQVPPGPTAVMCAHGERAVTAASLLTRAGRRDVSVVVGGAEEWASRSGGQLRAGRATR